MPDFLDYWVNESEVNAKLVAQERLKTQETETLMKTIKESDIDSSCEEIGDFIKRFTINQEPLGSEFTKVLHMNLWNLYES